MPSLDPLLKQLTDLSSWRNAKKSSFDPALKFVSYALISVPAGTGMEVCYPGKST